MYRHLQLLFSLSLPCCSSTVLSFWLYIKLSLCSSVVLSLCRSAMLQLYRSCHAAMLQLYRSGALALCHTVPLSCCRSLRSDDRRLTATQQLYEFLLNSRQLPTLKRWDRTRDSSPSSTASLPVSSDWSSYAAIHEPTRVSGGANFPKTAIPE